MGSESESRVELNWLKSRSLSMAAHLSEAEAVSARGGRRSKFTELGRAGSSVKQSRAEPLSVKIKYHEEREVITSQSVRVPRAHNG